MCLFTKEDVYISIIEVVVNVIVIDFQVVFVEARIDSYALQALARAALLDLNSAPVRGEYRDVEGAFAESC